MFHITRPAWFRRAACHGITADGTQPNPFFPTHGGVGVREARKFCESCDVRAACLAYAIADPSLTGFWAGTTEDDRDRLRARRAM